MEPHQRMHKTRFILDGVGRGEVVFERIDDPVLESYVAYVRSRGKEVIAPYGPLSVEYHIQPGKPVLALTPCELDLCLLWPLVAEPPPCLLELPSRELVFEGVPWQPDEGLWPYRWMNWERGEVVLLLPNWNQVLEDITIRFRPRPQAHPVGRPRRPHGRTPPAT